uniref:Uncharacterized protein n=1 Tax=Myotis myotis TaxID=51298 RepID=A0A7J7T6I3_MYOMY|nr:hypothetical protein mMyoMyo1_009145 [Myotis myotis]
MELAGRVRLGQQEVGRIRASPSPPLRSHVEPTAPLSLFSSFPFLLKEFPTSWRARTSAVTLMREAALLPLAVAVSLPVEPTSAVGPAAAAVTMSGQRPPAAVLFSSSSLMSDHRLLKKNLLLLPGLGAQISRSLGIRRAGLGPFEDY